MRLYLEWGQEWGRDEGGGEHRESACDRGRDQKERGGVTRKERVAGASLSKCTRLPLAAKVRIRPAPGTISASAGLLSFPAGLWIEQPSPCPPGLDGVVNVNHLLPSQKEHLDQSALEGPPRHLGAMAARVRGGRKRGVAAAAGGRRGVGGGTGIAGRRRRVTRAARVGGGVG
eukprot:scaffold11929_cov107-Isochrysis_galbana.AAC.11